MADLARSGCRFLDTQLFETLLGLAFITACFTAQFGFIRLVGNVSPIDWITRGVNALWRFIFVPVLIVVGANNVHAHKSAYRAGAVIASTSRRRRGAWTGVGETPRQGNEIKGNFIAPDGTLRHCTLRTDGCC
jgi:hypothetical protein